MSNTDIVSTDHSLLVNSCGINRVFEKRIGSVRPHGRHDYHMLYIAEGMCHACIEGVWHEVEQGGILFYYPGQRQEYFFDPQDKAISYYVHFTGKDCEQTLRRLDLRRFSVLDIGKNPEVESIFAKMIQEHTLKQRAHEEYSASLLLGLLAVIARKNALLQNKISGEHTRYVQRAIRFMYEGIGKELSVSDVCLEIGLSEGYFSRIFRSAVGMSPYAYMTLLRIEKAKDLLLNTDLSISEIGQAVDFCDQSYFSRFFKKRVGISPSAYRKIK